MVAFIWKDVKTLGMIVVFVAIGCSIIPEETNY